MTIEDALDRLVKAAAEARDNCNPFLKIEAEKVYARVAHEAFVIRATLMRDVRAAEHAVDRRTKEPPTDRRAPE